MSTHYSAVAARSAAALRELTEKVASIRQAQSLENVREAVKMASAGYIRMADVSDTPGRGSTDPLTMFCLGAD